MPQVLILQHAEGEWIGSMESWFNERDFQLTTVRLDLGKGLPEGSDFDWLLIMGGPMSVYEESRYPWLVAEKDFIREAVAAEKTVLGICLGSQLIASALGARVEANQQLEIGWFPVQRTDPSVSWMPESFVPLSWHGDFFQLPEGARSFATSAITPCQGYSLGDKVIALQFHLEAQPGTVQTFYSLQPDGLPATEYVQSKEQIFADSDYLPASRKVMHELLNYLHTQG